MQLAKRRSLTVENIQLRRSPLEYGLDCAALVLVYTTVGRDRRTLLKDICLLLEALRFISGRADIRALSIIE